MLGWQINASFAGSSISRRFLTPCSAVHRFHRWLRRTTETNERNPRALHAPYTNQSETPTDTSPHWLLTSFCCGDFPLGMCCFCFDIVSHVDCVVFHLDAAYDTVQQTSPGWYRAMSRLQFPRLVLRAARRTRPTRAAAPAVARRRVEGNSRRFACLRARLCDSILF